MTTQDHAIQGALLVAIPLELLGVSPLISLPCAVISGVLTAWPDLEPVLTGIKCRLSSDYEDVEHPQHNLHLSYRYQIGSYLVRHSGVLGDWWNGNPWFRLHRWVDSFFHTPDGKWWPRDWKKAVLFWAVELAGIAWLIV